MCIEVIVGEMYAMLIETRDVDSVRLSTLFPVRRNIAVVIFKSETRAFIMRGLAYDLVLLTGDR